MSPMAITWAGKYISPKFLAPDDKQRGSSCSGVHNAFGIFSSAGARTPWHMGQKDSGAANLLLAGDRGRIWYVVNSNKLDEDYAKSRLNVQAAI